MVVDTAVSSLLVSEVFHRNKDGCPRGLIKESCDLLDDLPQVTCGKYLVYSLKIQLCAKCAWKVNLW